MSFASACLQVDVDGLWAVRRCYGRPARDTFHDDPVWTDGLPEFRQLFADLGIPASFFLVGRDLLLPAKRAEARRLADAGHEIANHSWSHHIGLTRLPIGRIREEIQRAHDAIVRTGLDAPTGFRAPGYDIDGRILRLLEQLGYLYDASMLPTRLSPLLRLADAWLSRSWTPEKRQFGRFSYGSAPQHPYLPSRWSLRTAARSPEEETRIVEFPVTTLPPFGFPLTASAIFAFGPAAVIRKLEGLRDRPILLLLHGIDLVDCTEPIVLDDRTPSAGGFDLPISTKRDCLRAVLEYVAAHWRIVRARDHVEALR